MQTPYPYKPYPSVHAPWYGYLFWVLASAGGYGKAADTQFTSAWIERPAPPAPAPAPSSSNASSSAASNKTSSGSTSPANVVTEKASSQVNKTSSSSSSSGNQTSYQLMANKRITSAEAMKAYWREQLAAGQAKQQQEQEPQQQQQDQQQAQTQQQDQQQQTQGQAQQGRKMLAAMQTTGACDANMKVGGGVGGAALQPAAAGLCWVLLGAGPLGFVHQARQRDCRCLVVCASRYCPPLVDAPNAACKILPLFLPTLPAYICVLAPAPPQIWALKAGEGTLRVAVLNKDSNRHCNIRVTIPDAPHLCKEGSKAELSRLLPGPQGMSSKSGLTWQGQTYHDSSAYGSGKLVGDKATAMVAATKDGEGCAYVIGMPKSSGALLVINA